MKVSRRVVMSGLSTLALSACVGGSAAAPVAAQNWPSVPNAGFDDWLVGMLARATARGISSGGQAALGRAGFLPLVIERSQNQTELTRTTEDYLAIATAPDRVAKGRAEFARLSRLWAQIETAYGVSPQIVTAIWGLESRYGERMGDAPLISALATLSYAGRRADFFEGQLIAALKILDRGDVSASQMTGSWAGAMGHTQFIPTTFIAHAVDFTGDGRRDIWGADPTDALASAAAYLRDSGWVRGGLWGVEVRLPASLDLGLAGRGKGRAVSFWRDSGITAATGAAIPDHGAASLYLTGGTAAPGFLLFRNFNVILRYNNAVTYALGIGVLSDRIAGGDPLKGQFPPDSAGMSLADRQALQVKLAALGYDVGTPDGVIGDKTRAAVSDYQRRNGLPETGAPSMALLARL
jgi:membrane-bound lytic murein transglycosylase B